MTAQRSRRLASIVAAALVIGIFIASGCGGSPGSTVSLASPSPTVAALSRRQLTHYLTAVTAVLASKASPSKATFNPTRPAGWLRFRASVVLGLRTEMDKQLKLRAIEPPPSLRSVHARLLAAYADDIRALTILSRGLLLRTPYGRWQASYRSRSQGSLRELSQWDVTVAAQARHEHVKLPDALRHLISSAP